MLMLRNSADSHFHNASTVSIPYEQYNLYPASMFVSVELPEEAKQVLMAAGD
jgi:hypothetical protein